MRIVMFLLTLWGKRAAQEIFFFVLNSNSENYTLVIS